MEFCFVFLFEAIVWKRWQQLSIKNQVLHHLGAGVEESVPGQSMERHKEPDDKKRIRTLLVGLTGDEAGQQIMFGEEVRFEVSSSSLGPRGKI